MARRVEKVTMRTFHRPNRPRSLSAYSLVDTMVGIALLLIMVAGAMQTLQSLGVIVGRMEEHGQAFFVEYAKITAQTEL